MKGGHSRSGPARDPNALRRERDGKGDEWLTLPAEGRSGDSPEWPLGDASPREAALWAREWRRPQAVVWEQRGQELEVALYVRSFAEAEVSAASTALRTLVRQMADSLGVTTPGLRANRWQIVVDEMADRREEGDDEPSSRSLFKVVPGGA